MTIGKDNYQVHLTRRKYKTLKNLEEEHNYLNRKTKELDEERGMGDRSSESKTLLKKLKITKLAIKDEITRVTEEIGEFTNQK